MRYKTGRKISRINIWIIGVIAAAVLVVAAITAVFVIRQSYIENLKAVSTVQTEQYFTVEQGTSAKQIGAQLFNQGLIRSSSAFDWYLRTNRLRDKLQAGTYALSPSMTTQQIVTKLVKGDVSKNLLTILPGKRLDQLKAAFKKAGYGDDEIAKALEADQYRGHPSLVNLPAGATLEGYLYPDSYQKTATTSASVVIEAALDQLDAKLTPQLKAGLAKQGLNIHQALIIGSIVEQEVSKVSDKPLVAQVFLKRWREGIPLGADPTSRYASVAAGLEQVDYSIDSPYNTRRYPGLPPGPIGNVSVSSLEALANPANTDYLFFVAGDDGITRFSKTQAEHEELTRRYCIELCAQ